MNLVSKIREYFLTHSDPRFRDNRGWYASALTSDARDLYWSGTRTKETNPTDLVGECRMFMGKAVEEALVKHVFSNLHFFGLHFYSCEQIPIGSSNPNVNGLLDGLVKERLPDGSFGPPIVVEVKTKQGFGAEMFKQSYDPGESYLAQIGYYLYDLNKKGVTNEGRLFFVLLSDRSYGEMIEICVRYNAEIDEVRAYEARHIDGTITPINHTLKLQPLLERLVSIEEAIKNQQLPPAEHFYKIPLTPEYLDSVSDAKLKKALDGNVVLGDWQISYSRYKDMHIKLEGTTAGYSAEEQKLLEQEYLKRYPSSKKFKKISNAR